MTNSLTQDQRKRLSGNQVSYKLNIWEIAVINKLRTYPHGRYIVHVIDGLPIRCETTGSEMIEQSEEFAGLVEKMLKDSYSENK